VTNWSPPGPAILFVPADRPERYAKAAERADAVIIDLEDAVRPEARDDAREALINNPIDPNLTMVRINPAGTGDHLKDLKALAQTDYRVVMLAKAESADQLLQIGYQVVALVETPLGAIQADQIAAAPNCIGLMWGAEDLIAAMGGRSSRFTAGEENTGRYRDVARQVRGMVRLACASHGRFAVDSVHIEIADTEGLRLEALDAVNLGYEATACIHPSQVEIVRAAYRPTDDEVTWAREVLAAAADNPGGVFRVGGQMIDSPLLGQAEAIMRRVDPATD
jgi:citrate lyase subunit beta / citryl-CoA lyase